MYSVFLMRLLFCAVSFGVLSGCRRDASTDAIHYRYLVELSLFKTTLNARLGDPGMMRVDKGESFYFIKDSAAFRLFDSEVHQHLDLSVAQCNSLLEQEAPYKKTRDTANSERFNRSGTGESWNQSLDEHAAELFAVLDRQQFSKLQCLDRYLLLRELGAANWLDVFDSGFDKEQFEEVADKEKQLWVSALQSGLNEWRKCFKNIESQLTGYPELAAQFASHQRYYDLPEHADASLALSHQPQTFENTFDDKFEQLKFELVQMNHLLEPSGNFRFHAGTLERQFGTQILDELLESSEGMLSPSPNMIQLTKKQNIRLKAWAGLHQGDVALHVKKKEAAAKDPETFNQWCNELDEIEQKRAQKMWTVFLTPQQQDLFIEYVRKSNLLSNWPAHLLYEDRLPAIVRENILEEFGTLEKNLEKIEIQLHCDLVDLVMENASCPIGFSVDDRPAYLLPSLTLMKHNAQQGITKEIQNWKSTEE
jgi:hypothetical protein